MVILVGFLYTALVVLVVVGLARWKVKDNRDKAAIALIRAGRARVLTDAAETLHEKAEAADLIGARLRGRGDIPAALIASVEEVRDNLRGLERDLLLHE